MYAVTVLFRIKPGAMPQFLPFMIENARLSREIEPGCRMFDISLNRAENEVFLYELYDDPESFETHLASPHFLKFDAAVADMINEKTARSYDEVIR